jgi:hypothetical protein
MGGGVQLGPLGTAATNRPFMPASGDYCDGENVWNDDYQGKPKHSEKTCPQCRFGHHKPHMLAGRKPGPPRWEASD